MIKKSKEQTAPVEIKSLDELEKLCHEPVVCECAVNGHPVRIPARRLTPAESAQIALIASRALPKIIPGAKPGEDRYDMADLKYIEEHSKNHHTARALALYLACPIFSARQPGLKDQGQITQFIQSQLTEDVLEFIFQRITSGVVTGDWVSFFSAPGSTPS